MIVVYCLYVWILSIRSSKIIKQNVIEGDTGCQLLASACTRTACTHLYAHMHPPHTHEHHTHTNTHACTHAAHTRIHTHTNK